MDAVENSPFKKPTTVEVELYPVTEVKGKEDPPPVPLIVMFEVVVDIVIFEPAVKETVEYNPVERDCKRKPAEDAAGTDI